MDVMITDISHDLDTTVQGVQVCITLFLLVMAALMIPCGKLTDRLGRKRCFLMGLSIYGVAALRKKTMARRPNADCNLGSAGAPCRNDGSVRPRSVRPSGYWW